jgi:hypothetical protein
MTKVKTIKIHGKDYVEVKERLRIFRENFPNYGLVSEVVETTDSAILNFKGDDVKKEATITIKASVINPEGQVIATGIAREERNSSNINKGSYVENCETSAWGRALANLGIGIDGQIASAEEMEGVKS